MWSGVHTLDLLKDLQHLAASSEGVDTPILQSLLIKLDKLSPVHVLEVVGVLVESQAAEPAGDVLQEAGVGWVLRGLRAAASTTRGATSHLAVVREIALVARSSESTDVEGTHAVVEERGHAIIGGQEPVVLRGGKASGAEARASHGDARRARARSATSKARELAALHSQDLLTAQNLTMLVDHDNSTRDASRDARREQALAVRSIAIIGPSTAVLANVVQGEPVVDS